MPSFLTAAANNGSASRAFTLLISHAYGSAQHHVLDGFQNYIVDRDGDPRTPEHRWLSEKIMGENPFLIKNIRVNTAAVQDDSEKSMYSSRSSK